MTLAPTLMRYLILVPLAWAEEPNDTSVAVGKALSVRCSARGTPSPIVEWFKLSAGKEEPIGSILRLGRASLADSGQFECRATNGGSKHLRKFIKVQVFGK